MTAKKIPTAELNAMRDFDRHMEAGETLDTAIEVLLELREQTRLLRLISREIGIDPARPAAKLAQAQADRKGLAGGFAASHQRRRKTNLKRAG